MKPSDVCPKCGQFIPGKHLGCKLCVVKAKPPVAKTGKHLKGPPDPRQTSIFDDVDIPLEKYVLNPDCKCGICKNGFTHPVDYI